MKNDYYVYVAKDGEDVVYVGSGRGSRVDHVNSGKSHSVEINKHVLTVGTLDVKVVLRNLSKADSLSEEQALQDQHKPRYNKNRAQVVPKKLTRGDYKIALRVLTQEYEKMMGVLSGLTYPECVGLDEDTDVQIAQMAMGYIAGLLETRGAIK